MELPIEKVVLPGDVVFELNQGEAKCKKIIVGPGLRRDSNKIISTKSGLLKVNQKSGTTIYCVDCHQKRYVPVPGENVIGIITKRGREDLIVDIGSSEPAALSLLSFENATKRNKPNIKIGDLIFGQVVDAPADMEPELVCVDNYGKSSGLGALPEEGFLFNVSLEYCQKLCSSKCTIRESLGQKMRFEITVGMNGRVWVKGPSLEKTLLISQAISIMEFATAEDIAQICTRMFDSG